MYCQIIACTQYVDYEDVNIPLKMQNTFVKFFYNARGEHRYTCQKHCRCTACHHKQTVRHCKHHIYSTVMK